MANEAASANQIGVESSPDRSLYWTVSFYIAPEELPAPIRQALTEAIDAPTESARSLRSLQARDPSSRILGDAIEPLFNDIADRERMGRIDDCLFGAGPIGGLDLIVETPEIIRWQTEGVRFEATPGAIGPQNVRLRRFWYIYKNGAASWNLSFKVEYAHTPAHFYFISMLQKVLAPKEFESNGSGITPNLLIHDPPTEGTGLLPLDGVIIRQPQSAAAFWPTLAAWFQIDAPELFDRLVEPSLWRAKGGRAAADLFGSIIRREPFLEVPGLLMPRFRYMFFFQDQDFFRRLLPPAVVDGRSIRRADLVLEPCYQPFLEEIARRTRAGEQFVRLDQEYWSWVVNRPDYQAAKARDPNAFAQAKVATPAWEEDTRPDCLAYLFLAGFNQNIIDFMNQDASEILDATDPIYPRTENQSAERFFVRFANARGLTSYVRASRSLEVGRDYIGTCPYAFLIHALAMANEFLARDYERSTHELIDDVKSLNARSKLSDAAQRFYAFRTGAFAAHFEDRYVGVFRYDTEGDVFAQVEQRRGTSRKTEYLEGIIANLEKQTGDLEARIQKREDRTITYAVGAVGAFGLFQVLLQIDTMLDDRLKEMFKWPLILASLIGSAAVALIFVAAVSGDLLQQIRARLRTGRADRPAKVKPPRR